MLSSFRTKGYLLVYKGFHRYKLSIHKPMYWRTAVPPHFFIFFDCFYTLKQQFHAELTSSPRCISLPLGDSAKVKLPWTCRDQIACTCQNLGSPTNVPTFANINSKFYRRTPTVLLHFFPSEVALPDVCVSVLSLPACGATVVSTQSNSHTILPSQVFLQDNYGFKSRITIVGGCLMVGKLSFHNI